MYVIEREEKSCFAKYAERTLHRPQFLVYFNFETGYT